MFQLKKRGYNTVPASVKQALSTFSPLMIQLLYNRGISTQEQAQSYLHPSVNQLHNPMLMHDMPLAVQILQKAKNEKAAVCVFGDYDADGICATVLLSEALNRYGLEVGTYTPERSEGYGLNRKAIEEIAKNHTILITVDLGITNHDEVRYAQELGLTVIVTDHHNLDNEQSPADAVLSPKLSGYPFDGLCGTGVAFKLAQALGFSWEECEPWLELTAVATVADIVPLRDENRVLAALGLECIKQRPIAGIAALLEVSDCKPPLTADAFGFQIGPRLNAAGRMANPQLAVELLKTKNDNEAHEKAAILNVLNKQRQSDQERIVEEALQQTYLHDFVSEPFLIVKNEKWNKGLIGLAAGTLCKEFGCPTAVFTLTDDETAWVGSFRGIESTDIAACLLAARNLAVKSGGHKMAGGATVSLENFDTYCAVLQTEIKKIPMKKLMPQNEYDAELSFRDLSTELAEELMQLAPFGSENPSPIILTRGVTPIIGKCKIVGKTQKHLQMVLQEGDEQIRSIGFGYADYLPRMPKVIDTLYFPEINEYNGCRNLQLKIQEIWAHDTPQLIENEFSCNTAETVLQRMSELLNWKKTCFEIPCEDRVLYQTPEEAISELLSAAEAGERGHLLVTRSAAMAKKAAASFENNSFRIAIAESDQYLSLSTILLDPYSCFNKQIFPEESKHWHNIWLLDGEWIQGEALLWAAHHVTAQVHVIMENNKHCFCPIYQCLSDEEQQSMIASVRVCE